MKNSIRDNIIKMLNKARSQELHAIFQYLDQHYQLAKEGKLDQSNIFKQIAIDEMRHAEALGLRIKKLGGDPVTEPSEPIAIDKPERTFGMFDYALENDAIEEYTMFSINCRKYNDVESANLFDALIETEKKHKAYFESLW